MKNKGLSLVEVLTAVAVLGMVVIAVTGFMTTGIKTSSRQNTESNLQKEAQTSLNQITDWVMSANHGIAVYGACPDYDQAVGIYHDGDTNIDKYVQILYYRKSEKRIYYDKINVSAGFHGTETEIRNAASAITTHGTWDEHLFCDYVKDFNMDITHINEKYVELKLVFELLGVEYNQEVKRITLRNAPVSNPTSY